MILHVTRAQQSYGKPWVKSFSSYCTIDRVTEVHVHVCVYACTTTDLHVHTEFTGRHMYGNT